MAVSWNYYDKFQMIMKRYLPLRGEGSTMATQIVTAVNKLVYKWYNDGDVYDNACMDGWLNDLSSYANWLAKYVIGARQILDRVYDCHNNAGEYEDILKNLADKLLDTADLEFYNRKPAQGTIYRCEGSYVFEEREDEEDEW